MCGTQPSRNGNQLLPTYINVARPVPQLPQASSPAWLMVMYRGQGRIHAGLWLCAARESQTTSDTKHVEIKHMLPASCDTNSLICPTCTAQLSSEMGSGRTAGCRRPQPLRHGHIHLQPGAISPTPCVHKGCPAKEAIWHERQADCHGRWHSRPGHTQSNTSPLPRTTHDQHQQARWLHKYRCARCCCVQLRALERYQPVRSTAWSVSAAHMHATHIARVSSIHRFMCACALYAMFVAPPAALDVSAQPHFEA